MDLRTIGREQLLSTPMCRLGVKIEDTWLEGCIERVRSQLVERKLLFRPHFWLSEEWFCPDGVPGVAIPFYLAHPRLMRLERQQMLEVEGGSREDCLKLLRHELGHAVCNAYRLRRTRAFREAFGNATQRYPESYRPNPASRRHVQHLGAWYAQAHPDEDFAETFAVWLGPRKRWRAHYARWPALRKLEAVDAMMGRIAGKPAPVRNRETPDSLAQMRQTLRKHYEQKAERYSVGFSDQYDRDLQRLFSSDPAHRRHPTAASFLRKHRSEIRRLVGEWTGGYEFTLDYILQELIGRCTQLKLRAVGDEAALKLNFAILLTVHSTTYQYRGVREWHGV